MKSLMGLPNTQMAGDTFVCGSGVLRYWSIATRNASVSNSPDGEVLDLIIRLIVFTPISALQFECGNATDERRWSTPQDRRKDCVEAATNSEPPSLAISSGIPNVAKMRLRDLISPFAPFFARSAMGYFEYLSTMAR